MRFDYNYIHRSGGLSALFDCYCLGWCHVKLRPSRHTFCVHHTTMHQFTALYEATHVGYTPLAVTSHLLFWHSGRIFLFTTSVTWEWKRILKLSQHRKLTLKSLPPHLGTEPATFRSRALHSDLSSIALLYMLEYDANSR